MLLSNEETFIELYWQIISKVIEGKKIRIADRLLNEFHSHQICPDEFNVNSDGYILWEKQSENLINESVYQSVFYEAITAYCNELEYQI